MWRAVNSERFSRLEKFGFFMRATLARGGQQVTAALLLERGEEREAARFLKQHLMAWLPDFAQRVGQRAETPFYAALAALTLAACEQCQRWLPKVAVMPRVTVETDANVPPGCGA